MKNYRAPPPTCTEGHRRCLPSPECDTWSMSPWHCHATSGRQARAARHHAQVGVSMQEAQELKELQVGGELGEGEGLVVVTPP
jgi:hypothetical protein